MSETYKWLFIAGIPFLIRTINLARQFEIELWLNSSNFLEELGVKEINMKKNSKPHVAPYYIL